MAVVTRHILKDEFSGPKAGERAPVFEALNVDGAPVVFPPKASSPVLLVLGSYSCPIFRANVAGIRAIHRDFGERVEMVYLYTTEAHPAGTVSPYRDSEWLTGPNRREGILLSQPRTLDERLARARETVEDLNLPIPVLVDLMGNSGWQLYGSAPSAAYLIDRNRRVTLRQGWVNPAELDAVLRGAEGS